MLLVSITCMCSLPNYLGISSYHYSYDVAAVASAMIISLAFSLMV